MLILSIFFTGVGVAFAGDPVGDGEAMGDATATGLETGAGLAGGLFGVSGLVSHAAKMAVAVARALANISFLIVFLLERLFYYRKKIGERAVRWRWLRSRIEAECLSAKRRQKEAVCHSKSNTAPIRTGRPTKLAENFTF